MLANLSNLPIIATSPTRCRLLYKISPLWKVKKKAFKLIENNCLTEGSKSVNWPSSSGKQQSAVEMKKVKKTFLSTLS